MIGFDYACRKKTRQSRYKGIAKMRKRSAKGKKMMDDIAVTGPNAKPSPDEAHAG